MGTRDRHLARTKNGFLYNPFWRHIGEAEPHVSRKINDGSSGTCFYKSGLETRWRTFDQILFSSAFLGSGGWSLKEEETIILRPDFLLDLIQSDDVLFDHLPVVSVLEKI